MKKPLFKLLTLLVISASFFQCSKAKQWDSFTFDEYGYQIDFPSEPKYLSQKTNSEVGLLDLHIQLVDYTMKGGSLYGISYTEYPGSFISSDKKEMLPDYFKAAVNGAVNNMSGELLSESVIEIDGYPGREIKAAIKNGGYHMTMRMYLVKNKFYSLQVLSLRKAIDEEATKNFFDSFELIK